MCAAVISDRISRGGISRAEGRGGKYSGDCDYRPEYGRENSCHQDGGTCLPDGAVRAACNL